MFPRKNSKKERKKERGRGKRRRRQKEKGRWERGRERETAVGVMQLNTRCWSLFDKKQNTRHISWKISSCPEATDPNFYIQASACSLLSWSNYSAGKRYSANNFSSSGTQQNLHTAFVVSGKVNFTPCFVIVFFLILIRDCIWPSR